jgi:hypothetical protein
VHLAAEDFRFLDRLLGPHAGVEIVRRPVWRKQIHRHHRKLQRRPTLEKQHAVIVGNACQRPAVGLRLVEDPIERLAAMAVLHDPDAAAGHVPDRLLRLAEDGLGQHGGAGAEIVDAVGHGSVPWWVPRRA